jgi:hypothetical protein
MKLRRYLAGDRGWGLRFIAWMTIVGLPVAFLLDWRAGEPFAGRLLVGGLALWVASCGLILWIRRGPSIHDAVVVHVAFENEEGFFEPECTCGWLGDNHQDSVSAFREARRHTEHVRTEVRELPGRTSA